MNLKEFKEKYNLKGVQIAKKFKASPANISQWMSGHCKPRYRTARRICRISKYEITLTDLGYK